MDISFPFCDGEDYVGRFRAKKSWSEHAMMTPVSERMCNSASTPIGAVGSQNGPTLKSVNSAVSYILDRLNSHPSLPDPTLTTRERNIIIRARYAAGVSQADLARQFGISYQRVHQIVHRRRKYRYFIGH